MMTNYPHWTSCERLGSTEDVICLCDIITHDHNLLKLHIALMAPFQLSRPDNQLGRTDTVLCSNPSDGQPQQSTGDDVCCLLTSKISINCAGQWYTYSDQ